MQILDHDRLIEAEVLLDLRFVGRVDHAGGAEQDIGDVAGDDPQQHENEDGDSEQGQEHQQEAPDQVGSQSPLHRQSENYLVTSCAGRAPRYAGALPRSARSIARLRHLSSQTSS
jgi:hypothetical protein